MIYLGDSFPARYRGTVFACNTHGHRINNDRLERRGSGLVAHHDPDFLLANDPWFKGVSIQCGPDGSIYICDWRTDSGGAGKVQFAVSGPPEQGPAKK